jgi:site-specific recombinase XerD
LQTGGKGKGGTERNVFLSRDARLALAKYPETERPKEAEPPNEALFLSAAGTAGSRAGGAPLLERIVRWHDAEVSNPACKFSSLRPHDLRHTFAF